MVQKVNELMDDHDRIVVGSVTHGDELLAVDNVYIINMSPQEVRAWHRPACCLVTSNSYY